MEMDFFVGTALDDMEIAFKWAKLFKESEGKSTLHRLILAGEYAGSAGSAIYEAKERVASEEWEIWREIYLDFRADLNDYIEK